MVVNCRVYVPSFWNWNHPFMGVILAVRCWLRVCMCGMAWPMNLHPRREQAVGLYVKKYQAWLNVVYPCKHQKRNKEAIFRWDAFPFRIWAIPPCKSCCVTVVGWMFG